MPELSSFRVYECLDRHGRADALRIFGRYEAGFLPRVSLRECAWSAGRLVVDLRVDPQTVGADGVARPVRFRRRGRRVLRVLPPDVNAALGLGLRRRLDGALDVTDEVERPAALLVFRDVDGDSEALAPCAVQVEATPATGWGTFTLRYAVTAAIDAGTAFDPALTPSTWDVDLAFAVCGLRGRAAVDVPDDLDIDPRQATARLPRTRLEVTALVSPPPARLRLHLRPGHALV